MKFKNHQNFKYFEIIKKRKIRDNWDIYLYELICLKSYYMVDKPNFLLIEANQFRKSKAKCENDKVFDESAKHK